MKMLFFTLWLKLASSRSALVANSKQQEECIQTAEEYIDAFQVGKGFKGAKYDKFVKNILYFIHFSTIW